MTSVSSPLIKDISCLRWTWIFSWVRIKHLCFPKLLSIPGLKVLFLSFVILFRLGTVCWVGIDAGITELRGTFWCGLCYCSKNNFQDIRVWTWKFAHDSIAVTESTSCPSFVQAVFSLSYPSKINSIPVDHWLELFMDYDNDQNKWQWFVKS